VCFFLFLFFNFLRSSPNALIHVLLSSSQFHYHVEFPSGTKQSPMVTQILLPLLLSVHLLPLLLLLQSPLFGGRSPSAHPSSKILLLLRNLPCLPPATSPLHPSLLYQQLALPVSVLQRNVQILSSYLRPILVSAMPCTLPLDATMKLL
jgi:hypothetical protein